MFLHLALVIFLAAHQTSGAPSASLKVAKAAGQKEGTTITVAEHEQAYLTSPGYPEPYENNLNVEYTITGPEHHYLYFSAESLDIEANFDVLTLSETTVAGKKFIGTFNSGHYTYALTSTGNVVRAVFRTDESVVASGFRIAVYSYPIYTPNPDPEPHPEPEAVQVIAIESGTRFTSPGYPEQYASNQQVDYFISAPEGHHIRFDVEFYELEQGFDKLDFYEYVAWQGYIYIGSLNNQTGNDVFSLHSNGNTVLASFRTDSTVELGGFSVLATSFLPAVTIPPPTAVAPGHSTVQVVIDESGSVQFTSPGYPETYADNLSVDYNITAPEGYAIQFTVEYFDIEQPYDSLAFYENDPIYGYHMIAFIYNSDNQPTFESATNQVTASFRTDSSVTQGGFVIRATKVQSTPTTPAPTPSGPISVELTVGESDSVTFTSPGYPEPYGNDLVVNYHITGPVGCHLQFDVDDLELESCCDHLDILQYGDNGISSTPVLPGAPIIVNEHGVRVYFRTDHSVTARGFSVRVKSIADEEQK